MHIALPKTRGDKLPPAEQRLGFLAAKCDPPLGYVGGYLITTARGRPIEFHYASPVKPSPTHRILYGAELEPYLLAELIGASLVKQATTEPAFIVTDQPHVLSQRKNWSCPVVCVAPLSESDSAADSATNKPRWNCHPDFPDDVPSLEQWLSEVNPGLNVNEPFVRLWEAIREVLAPGAKGQAA